MSTAATTACISGVAIGSLCAGPIAKLGRLRGILYTNIGVYIGIGLSIVPTFYTDLFYVLYIGRFILGFATGCFCIFCPKYINETSPLVIKGAMGAMTSVSFAFGRATY